MKNKFKKIIKDLLSKELVRKLHNYFFNNFNIYKETLI